MVFFFIIKGALKNQILNNFRLFFEDLGLFSCLSSQEVGNKRKYLKQLKKGFGFIGKTLFGSHADTEIEP